MTNTIQPQEGTSIAETADPASRSSSPAPTAADTATGSSPCDSVALTVAATPPTPEEQLAQLEGAVRGYQSATVAAARALATIHDRALYRIAGFNTLAKYTANRLGLEASRTSRLLDFGQLILNLPTGKSVPLPQNERQTRPLNKLKNLEDRVEVWTRVAAGRDISAVNNKVVQDAVSAYALKHGIAIRSRPRVEKNAAHLKMLGVLRQELAEHPKRTKIFEAIDIIEAALAPTAIIDVETGEPTTSTPGQEFERNALPEPAAAYVNPEIRSEPVGMWPSPVRVAESRFKYKSLSNFSLNLATGCAHGCLQCYVPSVATLKQAPKLKKHGVAHPDADWGQYSLVRVWDEVEFLASLAKAEAMPATKLPADGHRAVLLCTSTDAYQVVYHEDAARRRELNQHLRFITRRSLEHILERSTLNVRILTRSPLAREDFDLMAKFGKRLLFGMSLPTLRNDLARVYEPKAPAPSQRLATLKAAHEAGLHVFVAMAPTYPECDEADLRATLTAIREVDPVTIFHEPINVRAENAQRIAAHAREVEATVNTDVYRSDESWRAYAIGALQTVERVAGELGLGDRLHLWPDKTLGSREAIAAAANPEEHQAWLHRCWSRVSEWPGNSKPST